MRFAEIVKDIRTDTDENNLIKIHRTGQLDPNSYLIIHCVDQKLTQVTKSTGELAHMTQEEIDADDWEII